MSTASPTAAPAGRPRARRVLRRTGLGLAVLLAALLLTGGVLVAWKPWAPEIVVVDPAEGGRRVTLDGGLVGNYYPARTRAPAVLVIGGSEGGISAPVDREAQALNAAGFNALALSYWGAPGQPQRMEALPLESFDTGLDWLKTQHEVDPERLAIMGTSKGGEAVELVASRRTDLGAVVAYVPSNVVWSGLDMVEIWRMGSLGSTWSADGVDVPHLPMTGSWGGGRAGVFESSLRNLPEHPDAVIPIEKSTAPQLVVCGGSDTLWPSCPMSRELERRAASRGGPPVTVLEYPDAGHMLAGPPVQPGAPGHDLLDDHGGSAAANQEAQADGWPRVVAFLHRHLG